MQVEDAYAFIQLSGAVDLYTSQWTVNLLIEIELGIQSYGERGRGDGFKSYREHIRSYEEVDNDWI